MSKKDDKGFSLEERAIRYSKDPQRTREVFAKTFIRRVLLPTELESTIKLSARVENAAEELEDLASRPDRSFVFRMTKLQLEETMQCFANRHRYERAMYDETMPVPRAYGGAKTLGEAVHWVKSDEDNRALQGLVEVLLGIVANIQHDNDLSIDEKRELILKLANDFRNELIRNVTF